MSEPYILFQIDEANYAVHAGQVQQVEMVERITRVPRAPAFVQGIVYLRGQVAPVINVRRRFHLPDAPLTPRSRLVVTRLEDRLVALLVDSAREFARFDPAALQPLPAGLSGPSRAYLQGVFQLPDRLVLLLDLAKILDLEEQQQLSETALAPVSKKSPSKRKE
jgi:purine-binding chemotaxis protein CheW